MWSLAVHNGIRNQNPDNPRLESFPLHIVVHWMGIWNEFFNFQKSIIIGTSIRPEPGFVGSSLKNITVPEGRDVILSCTVKNLDEHKVAWIHLDRSAILTVDKQVITRNARIGVSHEGRHTWNLHIRDVQRSDAGAYMCQINTAKAKTRMGHLSVVGKYFPKFTFIFHNPLISSIYYATTLRRDYLDTYIYHTVYR